MKKNEIKKIIKEEIAIAITESEAAYKKTLIDKIKKEIVKDVKSGIVPNSVKSFADLHDYVDANCYGGMCDDDYDISKNFKRENEVQKVIDKWVRSGVLLKVK